MSNNTSKRSDEARNTSDQSENPAVYFKQQRSSDSNAIDSNAPAKWDSVRQVICSGSTGNGENEAVHQWTVVLQWWLMELM